MRSDSVKTGVQQAPHRSLFNALGITEEERQRPLIGIVSSYNEIVPGHMNLDKIVEAVKMGVAKLPEGVNFKHIFAVSVLCGIGFTMSIFISSLAFGNVSPEFDTYARLGILMGSTTAALLGYALLHFSLPKKAQA